MKNLTRAERKKAQKQFKPGDVVTYAGCACSHRVVEVDRRGVVVDVTSHLHDRNIDWWARKQPDGRYFMTILFDHNTQGPGPRCRFAEHGVDSGPPYHSNMEPDRLLP